jgi:hypothetical protein
MGIGENIMKYWKYYAIISAMITLGGWLYSQGGMDKDVENRIFSTPEIKYETEKYMVQKPSPEQEQRALILDSINNVSAVKSRAKRDSIYLAEVKARMEEAKARKTTDSINRLNADQLYQIKVEFDGIREELKRINN